MCPGYASSPHVCTRLQSAVLPVKYPSSFFLQLLLLPGRLCLVAHSPTDPNDPIAFVSASIQRVNNNLQINYPPPSIGANPTKPLPTNEPRIEILTIGVLPAYQHHGLARHMIKSVVQTLHSSLYPSCHSTYGTLISAHVSTSNASAINFYERMGLRVSSEIIRNLYRTSSYGTGDAYIVAGRIR